MPEPPTGLPDLLQIAREMATWHYVNAPQWSDTALDQQAQECADALMEDAGHLTDTPSVWQQALTDAFSGTYRQLSTGNAHGAGLITDLREIKRTLDSLPVVTDLMVMCPKCCNILVLLPGTTQRHCDVCNAVVTGTTM